MKTWRLLPVAGALIALAACDNTVLPTSAELRPSGDAQAQANCGYLGSGICAVQQPTAASDSLTVKDTAAVKPSTRQ